MGSTDNLLCGEELLLHIQANLDKFAVSTHETQGVTQAAVAITVVDVSPRPDLDGLAVDGSRHHDAALILTRRASNLKDHAGQWAFPGGRTEEGELPEETALRELEEEVGLELTPDRVIGRLDDFTTRSGFVISPVVAWGGRGVDLTPDPLEVASIHRIPIAEFLRKDAPKLDKIPQSRNPVLRMPVGNSWIAAPTAALIYQFREVAILGRGTRVAHYEQPFFAWN